MCWRRWGQAVELFPWFLQRRKINLKNICGMWKERKKLFFYLLLLFGLARTAMLPNDYQTKFHLGHWGLPFLINGAVVRTGILSKINKNDCQAREQIKLNQLRSHLFKLFSSSSAASASLFWPSPKATKCFHSLPLARPLPHSLSLSFP